MGEGRGIYSVAMFHVVADCISFATTFLQKSSLAHSVAPPLQTGPASLGSGLVCRPAGGLVFGSLRLFRQHMPKQKDIPSDVLLFWVPPPRERLHPWDFNARGRQSRPCAISGLRPEIYAPLGARPRRAVLPLSTTCIFFVSTEHVVADCISFATTFLQKSSLAHSVAPPLQTGPALLGSGLVCRPAGGLF